MAVRLGLDLPGGNLAVLASLLGARLDGIGVQAGHGGLVVVVSTVVLPGVVLVSALLSALLPALLSTLLLTAIVVVVVVVLAVSTAEPVLSPHQGRGLEVVDGSGLGDDGQTQEGRQCVLDQHDDGRKRWSVVVPCVSSSRAVEEKNSVGARPKRESKGDVEKERTTGVEKGTNERKAHKHRTQQEED